MKKNLKKTEKSRQQNHSSVPGPDAVFYCHKSATDRKKLSKKRTLKKTQIYSLMSKNTKHFGPMNQIDGCCKFFLASLYTHLI